MPHKRDTVRREGDEVCWSHVDEAPWQVAGDAGFGGTELLGCILVSRRAPRMVAGCCQEAGRRGEQDLFLWYICVSADTG